MINAPINVNPARRGGGGGGGMRERGGELMPRTIASFGLLIVAPGSEAISVVIIRQLFSLARLV